MLCPVLRFSLLFLMGSYFDADSFHTVCWCVTLPVRVAGGLWPCVPRQLLEEAAGRGLQWGTHFVRIYGLPPMQGSFNPTLPSPCCALDVLLDSCCLHNFVCIK
jgi:hypothetical protein